MMEFPIYRVVSSSKKKGKGGGMEIAVLVVRTVGDQAVMRSVNRHVHYEGYQLIGRHPDFYDGVDFKNARAEKMFSSLEDELGDSTRKLEQLDDEISQWVEQKRFQEMIRGIAEESKRFGSDFVELLLDPIRLFAVEKLKEKRVSMRAEAINTGVKMEHAKRYLADVQHDFPRTVSYVGDLATRAGKR